MLKRYLIAGLLVWLPLVVTVWVLHAVWGALDGLFLWVLSATQAVMPAESHAALESLRHIPGMTPDQAWSLAHQIDSSGSAVVWTGPLEQAELHHQQLAGEGLTMAPLERC